MNNSMQIDGNTIVRNFFEGMFNTMIVDMYVKSHASEEQCIESLTKIYDHNMNIFDNTLQQIAKIDFGGYIQLKKAIEDNFNAFKREIINLYNTGKENVPEESNIDTSRN